MSMRAREILFVLVGFLGGFVVSDYERILCSLFVEYPSLTSANVLDDDIPKRKVEPHLGFKKILLTGGAGFIGSHLAEYLLQRGDEVVIVDEMNDYYNVTIKEKNLEMLKTTFGNRVQVIVGDICNASLIRHVFKTEKPEWVLHMAARAGVRPSIENPFIYIHSNIEGTTRLLEESKKFGVKNFVFASSSSVYGGLNSSFFKETDMVDSPVSQYAATKRACELLGGLYSRMYGLNVTALRFFTVYGPRGRPDMAPFMFVDRVSRGQEISQFGDGTSSRDYTFIDDIVDGVVRALDRPHRFEIFNLGKGGGTSLKDFISSVESATGKVAKVKHLPLQLGDVSYTRADVSKAHEMLGYTPEVTIEDGIRKLVKWYNVTYGSQS